MRGMGKMDGGAKGGGMPMDKKPMTPKMHSQNDMSKHSSPEMAECQKATAAEMGKMVGYNTDKGSSGGMGKMGEM